MTMLQWQSKGGAFLILQITYIVGQVSVVLDKFSISDLNSLSAEDALGKLIMFWNIFFEIL